MVPLTLFQNNYITHPRHLLAARLREAAETLIMWGWAQQMVTFDMRICAETAMWLASGGGLVSVVARRTTTCAPLDGNAYKLFHAMNHEVIRRTGIPTNVWNDMSGRTSSDVTALLFSIADDLETTERRLGRISDNYLYGLGKAVLSATPLLPSVEQLFMTLTPLSVT